MKQVEASGPVTMNVAGSVSKRCPFADEADTGTVQIIWDDHRSLPELHALAEYLRAFTDLPLSHEEFALKVKTDLGADSVSGTWLTAGLAVTVTA
jgi:NADPH-dependent 7-cyano-7-deazaguanine reductase QueF